MHLSIVDTVLHLNTTGVGVISRKMRTRMSSRNHPIQPLSPKHQPWVKIQAPDRKVASVNMSKSLNQVGSNVASGQSVEQELLLRARIEQRSMEKQERLHDAVSYDRLVRRRQRQRVHGHEGDIIKQELSKANA